MEKGQRNRRASRSHKSRRLFRLLLFMVTLLPVTAFAQERACPAGFNDFPAMPSHFDQASVIKMPLKEVFAAGQQIFVTNFNACDGAGRPGTTGIGTPRTPNPALGPRFTRVSAPDANSCAGCHAQPQPGVRVISWQTCSCSRKPRFPFRSSF